MKHLLASNALPMLLLILLFLINRTSLTRAQEYDEGNINWFCPVNSRNYTSGSRYESNLINLLRLLVDGYTTGFSSTTSGEDLDIVYGLIQCRGDVSAQECLTCLNTSSVKIQENCPNKASATRLNDFCLLSYGPSTANNFSRELVNPVNVRDPDSFNKQLDALMKKLASKAVSEPSRFVTGSITTNEWGTIYGLVQCSRSSSSNFCSECLLNRIEEIQNCCSGKQGGRLYVQNCNVRFELYRFFASSSLPPQPQPPPPALEVPPQPPPPTLEVPPQPNDGKRKSTSSPSPNIGVIVVPIIIGSLLLLSVAFYAYLVKRKTRKRETTARITGFRLEESEEYANRLSVIYEGGSEAQRKGIDVPFFSFETILAATEDFSDSKKLGQGGFGPVYKGMFQGGQELAVKRLSSSSGQGLDEFKNEVLLIAKLQHRNLVRLLGYCIHGDEKLLLYEYLSNKSLDLFIFDRTLCLLLNWEKRFDIILGIARGILYLHQDSRLKIIHRDLKTSNILLDQEMNPKISDFGLARIFGGTQTEANTNRVVGTYGYMSPEYALDGIFSVKSDVYSFGIVLLEIISGKKNTAFYKSENSLSLIGHTWRLWNENKGLDFIDDSLRETCNAGEVLKCIHVGLLCVQEEANDRPAMSNVILMLGSETITLPIPKQPALVLRKYQYPSIITTTSSDKSDLCTKNEMTISEQEGR